MWPFKLNLSPSSLTYSFLFSNILHDESQCFPLILIWGTSELREGYVFRKSYLSLIWQVSFCFSGARRYKEGKKECCTLLQCDQNERLRYSSPLHSSFFHHSAGGWPWARLGTRRLGPVLEREAGLPGKAKSVSCPVLRSGESAASHWRSVGEITEHAGRIWPTWEVIINK